MPKCSMASRVTSKQSSEKQSITAWGQSPRSARAARGKGGSPHAGQGWGGVPLSQARILGEVPLPSKVLSRLGSQEKAAPLGRCQ